MSRLARRAATALAAAALATSAALGVSAAAQAQPAPAPAPPTQGVPTECIPGMPIFAEPGTPPPAGICTGFVIAECFVADASGLWVRVTDPIAGVKGYTFAQAVPEFEELDLAPCQQGGPASLPQSVG